MSKQYMVLSCDRGYRPEFSFLPEAIKELVADCRGEIVFLHNDGVAPCYLILELENLLVFGWRIHGCAQRAALACGKRNNLEGPSSDQFADYLEMETLSLPIWEVVGPALKKYQDLLNSGDCG